MALTPRRWLFIAAVGALALAVAYLPPEPLRLTESSPSSRQPERIQLDRLNNTYGEIAAQLRAVQFRDSLRRTLATRRDTGAVNVAFHLSELHDFAIADENHVLVRAAAQRLWNRVQPMPGTRLMIIVGGARKWQSTYVLPAALDGRTCVAMISLDWNVQWLQQPNTQEVGSNLEPWLRDAAAPCLYYAAFGNPGPEIEAWLTRRSFVPAYTADWDATQPTLRFEDDPSHYEYLYYNASFDALACTDGRAARCGEAIRAEPVSFRPSGVTGMVHRIFLPRSLPAENYYLAALVHDMGRDRFGTFWRSSSSVPEAFAAAFGEPMDQWTAAWARRSVPDLPPFGPRPRPVAVLLSVLMAGIAITAAAAGVMRRRVG